MRGGINYTRIGEDNRRRRMKTRGVNGVDQSVNLNRALWLITEHFAKQRMAA